ncbi:MAG: T9SS type A sorting domain-containing protein, partial [Deinococcus-Thermus bacterium]|jgi:hypothetical protein|nr:T9SS type A sorting domain-containing protein [Deinococcota bacterium]
VTYRWQLAADPGFEDVLLTTAPSREVQARITYATLDSVLAALGADEGQTRTVYHRALATDGSAGGFGPGVPLNLRRGDVDTGAEAGEVPVTFALEGNYPNPFNPTTTVRFDLPQAADVEVTVYDVLGRRVLREGAAGVAAGRGRTVAVDASRLASGVYLYRVTARAAEAVWHETGTMVVVK